MSQRLDYKEASPEAFDALIHLERVIHKSGLEASLLDLVKCRSSQINGCAWCLDMHTKDARARGETEQRLYLLSAWQDAPGYTERERAAWPGRRRSPGWPQGVPDDVLAQAREHFSEKELVDLNLAIIAINGWNRMNISFRTKVGDYVSPYGSAGKKGLTRP